MLPVPHPDPHPRRAALTEQLAELLAEVHDLRHVKQPYLLVLFQQQLGAWELKLLKLQCDVARTRRQIDLIQASLNQGVAPNLQKIQAALEQEFLQWQQRLHEHAAAVQAAQGMGFVALNPAEHVQLKQRYRQLVKQLHPDLHPAASPEQMDLWHQVCEAYAAGNLLLLGALALIVTPEEPLPKDAPASVLENLTAAITHQQILLAQLQTQPPFCHEAQWTDPDWIAQRRVELEQQAALLEAQRAALEQHLTQLLPPP